MHVWRRLAWRLKEEGLSQIDTSVYQTTRLLRLVNSRNSKSGLFKIPIEYKEIRDLGLEYVLDVARRPRELESMAEPTESPKAIKWLRESLDWLDRRPAHAGKGSGIPATPPNGWRVPRCIRHVEQKAILPDGMRHEVYFALARFYASIGMHPDEASHRLKDIDQRHPIRDSDYIDRIARYDHLHPGFRGCPNEALGRYCDPTQCHLNHDRNSQCREKGCRGN